MTLRPESALLGGRSVETGKLLGEFPFVRVGDGPRALIVVPGVGDAIFNGEYNAAVGSFLRAYYRRYTDSHTVYVVSRPRGLPVGYGIGDMADDYARVADELGGADVLGISMGGFVAQTLAADYPDLVDRLVLAVTGARTSEEGRAAARRWRDLAEDRAWYEIRAELVGDMFSDWRRVAYPSAVRSAGVLTRWRRLLAPGVPDVGPNVPLPEPADPNDVTVTMDATLAFDGTDRLGDIEAPTLVFGGEEDPYFPAPILRDAAERIPDARLRVVPGGRHGVYHEEKAAFDHDVTRFLSR
jgi:pimeloyl-ACP methyl ester carboxylesterase